MPAWLNQYLVMICPADRRQMNAEPEAEHSPKFRILARRPARLDLAGTGLQTIRLARLRAQGLLGVGISPTEFQPCLIISPWTFSLYRSSLQRFTTCLPDGPGKS